MATPLHEISRGQEIPLKKQIAAKMYKCIVKSGGKEAKKHVYTPQFLSVRRGWLVGSGSGVVTSSPAAAICPLVKASYRSSWFTTAPLKPTIHQICMYFNSKELVTVYTPRKVDQYVSKPMLISHNAHRGLHCLGSLPA